MRTPVQDPQTANQSRPGHALGHRSRKAGFVSAWRMLIRLRDEDAISDEVLRGLEQELDLEAVRAGAGNER